MALYQAVFPDTYVEPCIADTPTYTITKGDLLDTNSPLTPFHRNAAGDWWTSENSKNIGDMGYTYPELANNPPNATLVANIKAQYSDAPTAAKTKRQDDSAPKKGVVYLAEVKIPLYGLDNGEHGSSPFNVLVFVGDVPSEAKEWLSADSFVSMTATLGGVNMQSKQFTISTHDLTAALEKNGKKADEEAAEWLKENLHWRIGLVSTLLIFVYRWKVEELANSS